MSGTATYADKTAAANKTITATGITVSGTDSANYTPNTSATTTATISQRALTISGTYTPSNTVYDATTTATVTTPASPTLATIQGSDIVSLSGTPSFAFSQSGIGSALAITTSGYSLTGTDAVNYTLTLPVLSANITIRTVTVGGTLSVASTKVYDGTLAATFVNSGLLTLANVPAGDAGNSAKLALSSPVAQYATKTVGTSKTVSLFSASLSGTSASNYTLSTTGAPTATANITQRSLTVTATGVNKTYDGTTTASVTLTSDKIVSDTVTLAYTSATYATKIVETNKTVSVSGISISGTDAANYTANTTATTTANITQRSLTVTISASNKVYDAGTSVSVTYGSNKVGSDAVTITGTASFANKNVGTSKTVTASGISISGADSANYTANTSTTTTANITAKPLLVSITASDKVYNGSTAATVTYADDRISGDSFSVSGTANFDSAAVGTSRTVTANSISLSGTDSANYSPNTTATTTANITVRTLTVTISGGGKTYDASTTATVSYSSDKVAADTLTITGAATFADKAAGSNKTITATGIAISGASSANYVLGNTTATTTATISKRTLTITGIFTASNRIYDGTTDATGNVSVPASPGVSPVQGADDITLTGTPVFTYASAGVGTAVAITSSGYSITGADTSNYTLTQLSLSSNITVRTVTIGGLLVVPSTKTYDSTTTISITDTSALTLVNVASADAGIPSRLALTGLVAQYANKTVGSGKTVSLTSASLTGSSLSNYVLSTVGAPTASADITLRPLNVTISATSKVYNASTTATVTYSDNRVSGDQFSISGTATFDSKNFGTGKTVTASGITLTGTDAANYSQNSTATTAANITRRSLTVTGTFTVANRQYDATTDATPQITLPSVAGLSDVQSGDDATLSGTPTFTFAQATVGNSIAITTSGYSVVGADAANYVLTQPSFTANITQRPLTIGGTLSVTSTKVYNRTTAASITDTSLLTLVNVPAGDANDPAKVALASLTATYDNKNVGTAKTVTVATASLTGTTASNYTITTAGAPTTTADITQRPITLGFTMGNKTYDGTANATVTFTDTRISGDTLTVSGTPTYPDKNVGTNRTVTATNMSISGADAPNYSFNTTATATSTIFARALAVTITASSKTYDGNAAASVLYADNRISGDVLTVSGTATFSSKTYGISKTVTASSITLSGTDAANYSPNSSTTTTATINRRALTVTISAVNKVYDRTTTASVTYSDDRVSGDILVISSTPTFSDKNVGTGKTVTASGISLSSTDSGNYTVNTSATTTADITKRSLTIGITPSNKVYNANTTATVAYTDNRISGDSLTFSSTNTFSDKNAGTGKTVTASGISVSNTDAGNYDYNTTATALANITKRPLTVTGTFTVANRHYDATTDATSQVTLPVSAGLSDVQSGDDATLSGTPTFTFAQATVGTGIGISTTGYSVIGTDADNYALTQPSFTANITQRPLTIGGALVVASSKVYDRGVTSSITDSSQLQLQNVPAGDANNAAKVGLSGLAASYGDKNVGTNKAVTLTAASLSGTTSSNYTLTISGAPTTTADITRRSVTISITPTAKTYDGTDTAAVTYQDTRLSGDSITASGTATFSDKNVGTNKTVTASGITLSGTDAGNYTPNTTATNTSNITRRSLTVTTTGVNKVYDRTTTASVTFSDNRVSGDTFSYSATSTFSSKTVGTGKAVSTSGITLSGTDSGNYTPNTTASTTANITARPLAVTITASNKVYNGNTSVSVTYLDDRVSGDLFTVSGSASFDNKNIGTSKTVTASSITISGTDAANYTQNTSTTTTADITVRTLTVTAVADTKVYDATTSATAVYSDDRVSGDIFTVSGTATFSSKTAAAGKTVSITDITITGTDAGNYQHNLTTTSTAEITQRPLEVTGTLQAQNKVYDGSRTATYDIADLTLVGVQGSDLVGVTNPRGRFRTDANVGVNKIVELTSFQFTGADLGNYAVSVNNSPITYASITPRTLNVTITPSNKTYDGTTAATVTYVDNRVSGDIMTVSGTATFSDKNVGTGKTVTATNITLTGTASGNYSQNTTTSALANIAVRTLAVTISASSKTYDGTTAATVNYADNRVSGDDVTVSGTSTFSSKTVATGKTVTATGITISGTDAANYTHNNTTTTAANITARSLAVTITASNKVYNASTAATVAYADNRVSGDLFTVSGTATFDDKTAANGKTVTATGIALSGTDAGNYTPNTSTTAIANITKRNLTVTGVFTVANRPYDATTDATSQITLPANAGLSDVQASDDTTLTGSPTFTFAQATVGTNIGISTSGYSLAGADAGNYSLTPPSFTANITQRPLTIGGSLVTASTKTYDRTTSSTITDSSALVLLNVPDGDANTPSKVALTGLVAQYADKGAATNKTVSLTSASLTGTTAVNYTLTLAGSPTTTADITRRSVNITISAGNKTYDATNSASVTYGDNRITSDLFTVSGTPTFSDKNVGTGKTVTASGITLSGTDANNYTPNTTATTTANITARSLAVTITASNKIYDGTTTAPVTYSDNRINGDVFTVNGTSTFATKTVGTSKTVTASSISLSGTDAANYTPNSSTTSTANITTRALVLTASAIDKTYNQSTSASVTISDDRVAGNILNISYSSATFASKTAGASKTVTVAGISVTGSDAPNYTYATSITTTATISQRTLNVTVTPTNKVYDGSATASVTYSDNRIEGDILTVSGEATYSSKTAVSGKTVTTSNMTITGTDAANYVLPSVTVNAASTANITPRALSITGVFTVTNRQYDATSDATAQVTPPNAPGLSDVQLVDDVTLSGVPTFTFAQATVGTGIGITTTGYSLTGADAANYTLTLPTFTANITQRPLTIGGSLVTPSSRVYNRTTSATITTPTALTLMNVPAGDANDFTKIALSSPVAAFADRNVGTGKTVTLTSATLSGTRLANYTLSLDGSPTAVADISAKSLAVSITASHKTYNSSDLASVTYSDDRIAGDLFTVSGTSTFSDKNVGTGKTVTATGISLSGTDAANYTPNTTATTTANITARSVTVTITSSNKVYDSTTAASVVYSDTRISGDDFTVTGTATFATKTIGTGKTVTANGISLSGTDAANYTPNTTATTTANITARSLAVTIAATDKVYDATATASVTYADNRVAGDIFTISGTPTFDDKNVGAGKTVTASGITLSGTDAANYTPNSTATATATITARTLAVTITASNKTYDATDSAAVTYADNRVTGDVFTVNGTPTFDNKNVGVGKTVTASGITLTGTDSINYTPNTTATTTANITAR
ncbi:MAG: YDG domain-containing protein, partial [Acidimicrobiaceae bacterium]